MGAATNLLSDVGTLPPPSKPAPRIPAGPDSLAASYAAALGVDAPTALPEWVQANGKRPDLPGYTFVYARRHDQTREMAVADRDGYGRSVDAVADWGVIVEYRRKRMPDGSACSLADTDGTDRTIDGKFVLPAIPWSTSPPLVSLIAQYRAGFLALPEVDDLDWCAAAQRISAYRPASLADLAAKLIVAIHFRDPEGDRSILAIEAPEPEADRLAIEMELRCLDWILEQVSDAERRDDLKDAGAANQAVRS